MQGLQRIWEDVRHGENIDLYVTVGVSILLAVLSLVGFASQSLIAPLTLAVLGLLAIASLVNRRKMEQMLEKAARKEQGVLFIDEFPPEWKEHMEESSELWILGVNLSRTITTYYSLLERKLKRGETVKALLASPDGAAIKLSAARRPEPDYVKQDSDLLRASLRSLCQLKRNTSYKLEIRVTDYCPSFGMFAIDPDKAGGALYLSYYPFKTPGDNIPKIVLTSKDGYWYDHFKMEMHNLWKFATPWDCESND